MIYPIHITVAKLLIVMGLPNIKRKVMMKAKAVSTGLIMSHNYVDVDLRL
jgi:hypothetical protein